MSLTPPPPVDASDTKSRLVGATELSWCKAVPGGTGITVAALLLSKPPDIPLLQNALRRFQIAHPILNSKLHHDPSSDSLSYVVSPIPHIEIQSFDLNSTSQVIQSGEANPSLPPFQLILEHELNKNPWQNPDPSSNADIFFASVYTLENNLWVVALKLHTSVCDRMSAVALVRKLMGLMEGEGVGGVEIDSGEENEVSLPIEECIPNGQENKPFWARGMDMLGYSLNSLRLGTLSFMDTVSPRQSGVIRLQLNAEETARILYSCESREIKLCGVLAAAGLITSHSLNGIPDGQWIKYSVVTLVDCRSILDPVLDSQHIGFYHSAILNTHDIKGGENVWELAKRTYLSFINAKNNKKHFTDMSDLNFLMCKAIENPGLTPSASLRTSVISVFENPVIYHTNKSNQVIGLEDYIVCASLHGVGPSIAIFDTIRDGKLDCTCIFPFPLHSREQMQEFVDGIKRTILDSTTEC